MNSIKTQLNQSKRERRSRRCKFCASVGFLMLLVFLISLTAVAQDPEPPATHTVETQITENTGQAADTTENTDVPSEMPKEKITGTADRMERYDKDGITILIGNAKTVRYNEQDVEIGFLNADKITLKSDPETDTTTEIVAEGNVEIRDQNIFATCDHAIMNNLTNIITLKENVVVLQNKDRLETKLFTFNRTTGKQTGEGGVKFKVTVTQAAPVAPEAEDNVETGTNTETDTNTGESETSTSDPEKTEEPAEEEADTENGTDEQSEGDSVVPETPSDANGELSTDTETPDDVDTDAEPEESETH